MTIFPPQSGMCFENSKDLKLFSGLLIIFLSKEKYCDKANFWVDCDAEFCVKSFLKGCPSFLSNSLKDKVENVFSLNVQFLY